MGAALLGNVGDPPPKSGKGRCRERISSPVPVSDVAENQVARRADDCLSRCGRLVDRAQHLICICVKSRHFCLLFCFLKDILYLTQ